jgi:hypothetical protein
VGRPAGCVGSGQGSFGHLFERDGFSDLRVVDVATDRDTTTLLFGDRGRGAARAKARDDLIPEAGIHAVPRRVDPAEIV